ncbi:MAG: hypothetical protein ACJ76Z_03590 [Thermoleophilaceae bacterium]
MSRRGRKRAREASAPKRPTPNSRLPTPEKSRSELRDEAARARLVPLREGERPRAVTVAAVVALALALIEIGFGIAGYKVRGSHATWPGVILFTALLLFMAWGLWRARYWAVLGMEALLGLAILLFALLLTVAANLAAVLIALGVIVPSATLFWFLIKAMARIQMPERR